MFFQIFYPAIYWALYETYKTYLPVSEPTFWESFIGGALAGSVLHCHSDTHTQK